MTAPGRGTVRSMGGNFGTDKTLYEIMVGEKDYDNANGDSDSTEVDGIYPEEESM